MNKNSFLIFTLATTLTLSACEKKADNNNGTAGASPEAMKPQGKFEMPQVKYPAAIIFEGGSGNPWFDEDGAKHTPAWRLYICLEKTTGPVSRQVEMDFTKLGNPIEVEVTWENSEIKEKLYTGRLNKVVIEYTYTTELSDTPETNYGYAYGRAIFKSKSKQDWELIYNAPNHYDPPKFDDDFFNLETGNESIFHFGQKTYEINGHTFYVSSGLDRFSFSEKDRNAHVVEACEKADQPIVWQFGTEIKK